LAKGRQAVKLLGEKLGASEFFLGTSSSPTTLDAAIFSYLVLFWKVPLPVNPLKDAIAEHPHLEKYLARILQRYFPQGESSVKDWEFR
jgi:glutathione S-transferase